MQIKFTLKKVYLVVLMVACAAKFGYAQCTADFDLPADTVCGETQIAFTENSTGTGTITYLWDFGDSPSPNNFSNAKNATHTFIDTGTLTIKLTITDATNCSSTLTKNIYVLKSPIAAFTRYNNCVNNAMVFGNTTTAPSNDTIAQWKWYFGTGDSSTQKIPNYTFSATGTYAIQLIATSAKGCADTTTQNVQVFSQPTISIADTQFCARTSVNFSVQIAETNNVTYSWRLGDGNSSVNKTLVHIYNTGGTYKPRVRVTHNLTDSCFAVFDSVTVYSLPNVNFSINNDTQCFTGNNVCITDLTTTDANGGAIIKRTMVFGDGFIDNTTPPSTTVICHQYADPNGGNYPISIEATDANQCFASLQLPKAVLIHPNLVPNFTFGQVKDCFSTLVTLTNTSPFDSARVDSFTWDFGDGATATTGFASTQHAYTTSGNYTIKLNVTDTFGCSKIVTSTETVNSVVVNFNPTLNKDTSCFYNNVFNVSNPVNLNANATWIYGDGNTDTGWVNSQNYNNPGRFIIKLRITADNCDTIRTIDTVTVLGPRANIGLPQNRFQCTIHDTVYFTNNTTLPYLSQHGPAVGNVKRIWDFSDLNAPQCTTDTKNGINVGLNCNFSRDSLGVKHWYTPGKEGCYRPRLLLEDTVWGCLDTSAVFLALQRPIAGQDALNVPPITGLSFPKPDCLGPEGFKAKVVLLDQTQPSCDRERYWVMWDSLLWAQSGNFNAGWDLSSGNFNYSYSLPPADTNGLVTIGLIIGNGTDSANNGCFDTAWYHHVFQFNDLYPFITSDYNPALNRCKGTTVNFRVTDTLQSGITNYSWDFGDGSPPVSGATAYKTQHTFDSAGSFTITLTLQNADGCSGTGTSTVHIGFEATVGIANTLNCVGDTLILEDEISNFGIGAPWTSSSGETIQWNFGDGDGFATNGSKPIKNFTKVGLYNITLALQDNFGCKDTIRIDSAFSILGAYARLLNEDTLVCPQLFQLKDSSRLYDPLNYLSIPANDSIVVWEWDVNPNNLKSFLQNPYFDFAAGGDYTFKLRVENTIGCVDSATETFFVKGPIPYFTIVGDSSGCSPLLVEFDNQSTNATSYTWNFRDATNNTITTFSDTNITNTYIGGGLYKPYLTAESSEYDSKQGRTVTCRAVYPDTASQSLRLVAVNASPTVAFRASNACTNFSINFSDSSQIDSGSISSYLWKFGDGDTSTQKNPTHTYADTGTYTVTLLVYASAGCYDSAQKTIAVAPPPQANFSVAATCIGQTAQFTDSSTTANAVIVRWEWNFGDFTTSVFQNPTKNYAAVNTYAVKLKILTNAGCADSVTKNISINPLPVAAFTTADVCRQAILPITNTSSISTGSLSYFWEFGDGTSIATTTPAKTFATTGSFLVRQISTSDKGCKDTAQTTVEVNPLPQANFSVNSNSQCLNQNVFSTNNQSTIASGTLASTWHFGDVSTANTTNATHTYTNYGVYTIRLVEQSNFGCTDTFNYAVNVYPSPTANFSINDTAQCLNTNSFIFTNSSTDTGSLSYSWNMGDGGSFITQNTSYKYFSDAPFTVRLIVNNGTNCKDTVDKNITVLPLPQPSFTINDTGQCVNNNLFSFTNFTTIKYGTYTSQWLFGDGGSSNLTGPTYTYTADSGYTVSLIGTSNRGCKDTTTRTLTVFPKPNPAFSINDTNQCINTNQYQFTNQSTIKYGTTTYTWYFGDGDSAATTNSSHVYTSEGAKFARLKATSNYGCVDSSQSPIIVYPKPQSSFIINDSSQCLNTNSFAFSGQSGISNGTISYAWDFGNGKTSTQQDTTLVYTADGTYTVTLINSSNFGCYDTVSTPVTVYPTPQPMFTVNDTDQCQQENSFQFANSSAINSGSITYEWTFGNEGTAVLPAPTFVFANAITHTVKLKATSNFNCSDSISKQVVVFPSPQMAFTINDTGQCLSGNQFVYTNQSTIGGGTLTYSWSLGDGFTSTQKDTTVVYANYGIYTPTLIALSDKNCPDTLSQSIQVFAQPTPAFTLNDTTQCLKANLFATNNQSTIPEGTTTYVWHWGNGDTASATQPTYSYPQDSLQYIIKLVATSNFGCSDSAQQPVVVFPQTEIGFFINDTGQCVNGNSFVYTNATTLKSGTLSYVWALGNGITSTAQDTTVSYANYGIYYPQLIATTNNGCKDTLTDTIQVFAKPNPLFTVNDTTQCLANNAFIINNQSTIPQGTITYVWHWGNGDTTSATPPPAYSYPQDSLQYNIKAVVTSNFGCSDSLSQPVIVYPQPVPDFVVNDSGQCVNNNIFSFTNNAAVKYGTLNYVWNFGDGQTATAKDTAIVYSTDSTFRVVLRATTNFGCTDTAGKYMVVQSKPNPAFSINDTNQCVNANLFAFTNTTTINKGTTTYNWAFGNNTADTAANPTIVYTADTTYTVQLLATSDFLCVDSITKNVLVFPKPQAAFSINDTDQCINTNAFSFANGTTIKYGTLSYWWQFGNTDTAISTNPNYVYPVQGTYTVTLIARSNNNCYDTALGKTILYPKPNPAFTINDTDQCLKTQNFIFTNTSTIDSGTYTNRWAFSDGEVYTDSTNITRVFNNPFTYTVELLVTSNQNCKDTISKSVIVYPHPNANFTGLKLLYCANDAPQTLSPLVAGGIFEGKNMQTDTFAPQNTGEDTVKYTVQVNGCYSDTSKYTRVFPLPVLAIGPDSNLCRQEYLVYDISFPNSTYLWSTGSTNPVIRITQPGLYTANLYNICDTLTATVNVEYRDFDCNFFFPNAFTPNGDVLNDVFYPYLEPDVIGIRFSIYTRWGEKIFESDELGKGWDGTYKGERVQDGVYLWKAEMVIDESGAVYRHAIAGQVHLMR